MKEEGKRGGRKITHQLLSVVLSAFFFLFWLILFVCVWVFLAFSFHPWKDIWKKKVGSTMLPKNIIGHPFAETMKNSHRPNINIQKVCGQLCPHIFGHTVVREFREVLISKTKCAFSLCVFNNIWQSEFILGDKKWTRRHLYMSHNVLTILTTLTFNMTHQTLKKSLNITD